MAWTQSDLDALDTAIKQGVRTVQFADRSVTYHSLDEMLKLRRLMQGEVSGSAGISCTLAKFDKG